MYFDAVYPERSRTSIPLSTTLSVNRMGRGTQCKQKGFAAVVVLVVVLVVTAVAGGGYYFLKLKTPEPRICTMDVKICPDGSSVGRTGPNCEFAPCPNSSPSPTPADASREPTGSAETTNRKTYTNNRYQFSIKYSQDWTVMENDEGISFYPPGVTKGTWEKFPAKIGVEPQILISVVDKPFSEPPKSWGIQNMQSIEVDGQTGFYYVQLGAPISPTVFDLPYENGNKTLKMELISAGENIEIYNRANNTNIKDADEETFKTMISSFKFLN